MFGRSPWIIAEIGSSHNGDAEKAEELICAAAESGADCAKFQYIIADEIVHPKSGNIELHGGAVPIYQRFKELEMPFSFYQQIVELCEKHNIGFLCTPFGTGSAEKVIKLGSEAVKIASPELTHIPLLRAVGNIPAIVSTGVSSLGDIETAVSTLNNPAALLHCVTSYPAPPEEYNLSLLPILEQLFALPAGVSDHSTDPLLVPLLARYFGASIIEKHITLDRSGKGLDDPVALTPDQFALMCKSIRETGSPGSEETMLFLKETYGEELVEKTCGDGRKHLSPSEERFYRTTNRSLIAIRDIEKGEILSAENVALLRSEINMKPGLPALYWDITLGKRTSLPLHDGEGVGWQHITFS
jgi:sialic acid synthase SpsE